MEVLITGMHRSGTSAVARLLAVATSKTLLDDPPWAIDISALAYRSSHTWREEVQRSDIVKCPRMNEYLSEVTADFRPKRVVIVVRDPRDVWASILEKVNTGRPTRMLTYERLSVQGSDVTAFGLAYQLYLGFTRDHLLLHADDATVLSYETFFTRRIATVSALAKSLAWDFMSGIGQLSQQQLGPLSNKNHPRIAGVDRWRLELSVRDTRRLEPAVASYHALLDRFIDRVAPSL